MSLSKNWRWWVVLPFWLLYHFVCLLLFLLAGAGELARDAWDYLDSEPKWAERIAAWVERGEKP